MAREETWKRRLLDLSLRNRLLDAKDGSALLPLACDDAAALEDKLAMAKRVAVASALPGAETAKRLKRLYRLGRAANEEAGVNALFVALGFLEWREKGAKEGTVRRAPILLMPVELERERALADVKLTRLDEDTRLNTTLVEFLRREFGIVPAGLDPLPQDDALVDVRQVFAAFEAAVRDKGWRVSNTAALGFFSFAKVALWHDLDERLDEMRKNPLVNHLLSGSGAYDDGVEVFPPAEIECHLDPTRLYCPLGADASQLTAILYSACGKSFVLHGPPGTGKSQTITNLIVHNLAIGRRVLFVSEKKAALDVVHKRLKKVGMEPFCLELHSGKTGKAQVLEQFAQVLDMPPPKPAGVKHGSACTSVLNRRDQLTDYVKSLHRVYPNGLNAYRLFNTLAGEEPGETPTLGPWASALDQTQEMREKLVQCVHDLATDWSDLQGEAFQALQCVRCERWSREAEETAAHALGELEEAYATGGALARAWKRFVWRDHIALPRGVGRDEACAAIARAKENLSELRPVAAYRVRRAHAFQLGLGAFAEALERGKLACADAPRVFEKAYARKCLDELLARDRILAEFSAARHDEAVRRFGEADELYCETVRDAAVERLYERLPAGLSGKAGAKTELGILRRECAKKMRHKPVRQLLSETRSLYPRLKPCFLMSPLSVAQYLPPDAPPFDLVVFDEASQIPVWDAIGALSRARQAVIVGDPMQMPPTNFFQKGDAADEDETCDETEDLESILDEALAAGLHATHLDWHYRSRHESLIAFSNEHYYNNRLNTFPAARADGLGVNLEFVQDGVYDARGKRTNLPEATALVDWLFREIASPRGDKKSIGVVTFSIAQKTLIESLIEKRLAETPAAAPFFDEHAPDAFFVKNLENVQGDERDTMAFSICYAPDAKGDFAMNFGPLNRAGGERRLNVAITRARERVVVFSSIHANQIDLARTKSVGAKHLKEFLDYAACGGACPAHAQADGARDTRGLMQDAAKILAENGFEVEQHVGASARPVDLAVKRPDGSYALAVLGDGPGYVDEATVRDRDANRTRVLASFGWRTHRLWSADFGLSRAKAAARLLDAARDATNPTGAKA